MTERTLEELEQENRELRELLKVQDEEFRFLVSTVADPVWVARDGRVLVANEPLLQALGYASPEDVAGRDVLDLVDTEDRKVLTKALEALEVSGASTPTMQLRLRRADGSRVVLEVIAMHLHYDMEPSIVFQGRDLSYRRKLTTEIMQADRLIAAGTLAAGVGHEINNPLAFLIANMDYVARQVDVLWQDVEGRSTLTPRQMARLQERIPEVQDALAAARQGGQRIVQIVKELGTFATHLSESDLTALDIYPVLHSARQMAWHQIRHRARYTEDLRARALVLATRPNLAQILQQLLSNAAQAIDLGDVEANEVSVSTYEKGAEVVIEVTDTGEGIPEGNMAQIFDPFFTTKEPSQGTGLGLSIVRQLLTAMGGRIEVESTPGEGSAFRVYLKKAPEEQVPPTVVMEFDDDDELPPGYRLMVVDDEEKIGDVLRRMLPDADVVSLQSGSAALERLRQDSSFDAILCDLLMPEMSGMELFRQLKAIDPHLQQKVIFMTGGIMVDDVRAFMAEHGNDALMKPFSRAGVISKLQKHWDSQAANREEA